MYAVSFVMQSTESENIANFKLIQSQIVISKLINGYLLTKYPIGEFLISCQLKKFVKKVCLSNFSYFMKVVRKIRNYLSWIVYFKSESLYIVFISDVNHRFLCLKIRTVGCEWCVGTNKILVLCPLCCQLSSSVMWCHSTSP